MSATDPAQCNRIHLLAHANPAGKDIARFGFAGAAEYLAFIRENLPQPLRLTATESIFEAEEDEYHGGRSDDAMRIRDLQDALDDPRTLAIIAANGGAYFSRILPHIDFSRLTRRRGPLWALGFSEMTTLVNLIASYRCGRGVYWLCPNYLAWQFPSAEQSRAALAEFWRLLPRFLTDQPIVAAEYIDFSPIRGELASGSVTNGRVRLIGGCISVLAAMLPGPLGRRLLPDRRWLIIEDLKEDPYRVDRYLAALQFAGWFERIAGVLVGDFHTKDQDQQAAVLELLPYHVPRGRKLPIVKTRSFGHVWPMSPVMINRPLEMRVDGTAVAIAVIRP
jgi:muramoyltetrapeptide carboxypeptidase